MPDVCRALAESFNKKRQIVGTGVGQIKTASACRSECIAKYNRLLVIERELGRKTQLGGTLFKGGRW